MHVHKPVSSNSFYILKLFSSLKVMGDQSIKYKKNTRVIQKYCSLLTETVLTMPGPAHLIQINIKEWGRKPNINFQLNIISTN